MIYDCFTFYNELDLLEIRLNTLNDVVDKFVLIESIVTYTNQKKPLYYSINKSRYKFHNKIIHVVVRDSPNVSHTWIIEHFLMAAAQRGLKDAKPNDIILISNLDEIPNPEKILKFKNKPGKLKVFEQQFFYYYLNFASTNKKWLGTKMLTFKDFKTYMDAYVIRHSPNDVVIPYGGWHFSYMGGIKTIQDKMATGSHQEYNNSHYNTKEKIIRAILKKKDIFGHGDKFDFVSLNSLPTYLQENQKKYSEMFLVKEQDTKFNKQYMTFLEFKHILRVILRAIRKKINN
jgi:beta-1,4-mannosyl-glycoprotein beta-1,4-N-acetylglucosaminyltransferase